ncbi:MAG: IclR family transcriptional regulator [Jatrophihabitans sp.]|nr:MAG: IclR family transcriptional regulator [Jatrophihabitans sp.]
MVERVTLIMDAFERRTTTLTLEQVTAGTGLPRSTAHRILDQLVQVEWLEHTSCGYALGARALRFGGQDGSHGEIREAAAPVLQELFLRTGMVVHLAVLDEANVYYLDKVGGALAAALPSRVGGRVPAHTTAIGKALLAWQEPERVDEITRGLLVRRTARSIGDLGVLHQELSRIRTRNGLAFENGEAVPGVACVAAAIRGHRGAVAAISLCGEARTAGLERVAPLVLAAAREVSRQLFPELARPQRAQRAPGPWQGRRLHSVGGTA